MEKIDDSYDILSKKLAKFKKEYNILKERNAKLEVENKFLNNEIKNLKETNFKLLKFQDKKERIVNKVKKILSKLESCKDNNGKYK
jgi:flagellar biosynthesis/type III secretory pathway chaperone